MKTSLTGSRSHYSLSKSELADRVEEALRRAALWDEVKDVLHRPGTALSGGQQQRLCIARTIVVEPELLLMDEPCSAIDPIGTAKIEELINELKAEYTIVIVTHNLQQAVGRPTSPPFLTWWGSIEFGATQQIFTNPANKQTERYITGRVWASWRPRLDPPACSPPGAPTPKVPLSRRWPWIFWARCSDYVGYKHIINS